MFSLLSPKFPPKAGDRVQPLHFFDDGPLWRAFILYSLFVFDEALDAESLRTALAKLITEKEGWSKLGARLRKDKQGNLEYHIPSTFSADRPALAYTHVHYDYCAFEHPLASRLPTPSSTPSVVCDPDDFLELMRPLGAPMKLNDYINADIPQLGLHIVSFKDTTLVSLYWPHTLFDAMGQKALLEAWTLMIQDRGDEVKAPHGADFDPFTKLGTEPKEEHKLLPRRMGTYGLLGYGLNQVMDFMRKQENRMVCVPASFIQQLRVTAIAELAASDSHNSKEPPFLSEGDVLCAWWTRFAIAHFGPNTSQTVVLNNAYDIRKVLRPDTIPQDATYVSNAIGFLNVLLPSRDIVDKPISHVASAIREAITSLGTRAQVEAFYSLVRESQAKLPPFFGDKNMHMITYSNWTKAELYETDFSAAVAKGKEGKLEGSNAVRPRYIQNNQFGFTLPNGFPIIGKDNSGNFWLSGYMNKGHWAKIEELLAREA